MPSMKRVDEAFHDLLGGHAPEGAAARLLPLVKVAAALEPAERPGAGPSPQFKARLRSELLARASMTAVEEERAFAALLDGQAAAVPSGMAAARAGIPAEMAALAKVAAALEPASRPEPGPSFRFQLRNQLMARAARKRPLPARVSERVVALNNRMRRSLRVVGAMGMAAMLMLGSSAAFAASSGSLPGDTLYGVKRFRERAQLVTVSGATEGRRLLDFARTRLVEVRGLTRRGETDQPLYVETLNDMDEQTNQGATLLIDAFRAGDAPRSALDHLTAFGQAQVQDLEALLDALPPGVRPVARDSIVVASQTTQRALDVLNGCPCPANPLLEPPSAAGEPATTSDSSSVGCACEQDSGFGSGDTSSGDSTTDGDSDQGDGNGTSGGSQNGSGSGENPDDGGEGPGQDPDDPNAVPVPDVGGTDADDNLENQIDDIIDELLPTLSLSPLPSISLP